MLITGGDSGIGYETALNVARQNGTVVIASLSPDTTGKYAKQEIEANVSYAKVDLLPLDLSDFSSIHACAAEFLQNYDSLDVLLNDAGIDHNPPSLPALTKDGFERVFQVVCQSSFAPVCQP